MRCRKCNSRNTRVIVTEHHGNETWRYCRCLDCETKYKTIETYAIPKYGSLPGVPQHPNCIRKGENSGSAVLTEQNVRDIRRLAKEKITYKEIASRYGIHKDTVYRIVKKKRWNHVQ